MTPVPPLPPDELGDDVRDEARRAIEALVLVGEQPVDTRLLSQLLELAPGVVEDLCRELAAEYEAEGRGFQLARVAGGWRYQTHPDQAPYVERFVLEGQTAKLSAAALETLAIVAYKQPISRAQVGAIRGVSVDGVMRTLVQRGYIAEVGRDPGPGQAAMFGTTPAFLEKLGVDGLADLPALADFVPGADVVEQLERGLRPDSRSADDFLAEAVAAGDSDDGDTRDLLAEATAADGEGGSEDLLARPPPGHDLLAGARAADGEADDEGDYEGDFDLDLGE
jgi:segregation and condensation protein B